MRIRWAAVLAPILVSVAALFLPARLAAQGDGSAPHALLDRILLTDPDLYQSTLQFWSADQSRSARDPVLLLASHLTLAGQQTLLAVDSTNGSRELIALLPNERVQEAGRAADLRRGHLSDRVLSLTIVGSELLDLVRYGEGTLGYRLKLEAFLRSPLIDDYLSDGNTLLLALGCATAGWVDAGDAASQNRAVPSGLLPAADAYVVARGPYTDQVLVLRVGAADFLSAQGSAHASVTFEFPTLFRQTASSAPPKAPIDLAPYVSLYAEAALAGRAAAECRLEVGARLRHGAAGLVLYGAADVSQTFQMAAGLKAELYPPQTLSSVPAQD